MNPDIRSSTDKPIVLKIDFGEWGLLQACLIITIVQIQHKPDILHLQLNSNEQNMVNRIGALLDMTDKQMQQSSSNLTATQLERELNQAMTIHDSLPKIVSNVFLELMENAYQRGQKTSDSR